MSAARHAVVFSTALLAGCVLFVDTTDEGTSCHFSGQSNNLCGLCVAKSCQTAVNTCCGAGTCAGAMNELDACASGGGCAALFAEMNAEAGALAQCVKTTCASQCSATPTDAGSVTTPGGADVVCGTTNALPGSCSCSGVGVSVGIGGGGCSAATLGGTAPVLCCADTNYPSAADSICLCEQIVCGSASAETCECDSPANLNNAPQVATCTKNPGWVCCKSTTTTRCFCGQNSTCTSGFNEVDSCSPTTVTCPVNQLLVTQCN